MIFNRKITCALGLATVLSTSGIIPTAYAETTTATSSTVTASTQTASQTTEKKLNLSPIFIQLSDAMGAIKAGDMAKAKADLSKIQTDFNALPQNTSPLGQKTSQAISTALANPTNETLSQLSTDLYAFEKEQNPVDYTAQRQAFSKKMLPAYDKFSQKLQSAKPDQVEAMRAAYNEFNSVWLANEKVVRNTSMGHYGKIETAMALIRVSIESQPMNISQMQTQSIALKTAIDSYNAGDTAEIKPVAGLTLKSGISRLQEGLSAFKAGDTATGQSKLGEFITMWPSIEGDVSTRNPSLYNRVETLVPVAMAHGSDPKYQTELQSLISELSAINPTAQYTAVDSMLILLREGLEALLLIMALLSALKAAKQPKGKKWVLAGVVAGLVASVLAAVALQQLFPTVSAGASREAFEGVVGILAVIMMVGVGAWLHSKASIKTWNAYVKKQMGAAMTTGSFVSLFGVSFLSVFREGAETILFYVGILSNISMRNFLLGIGMALTVLAVVAYIMLKTTVKLPIPTLFKVLTWIVYLIGFKVLGMSIHLLQLTGYVPLTTLPSLPAIELLGIYPTVQTIGAQVLYILIIVALQLWMKSQEKAPRLQQA